MWNLGNIQAPSCTIRFHSSDNLNNSNILRLKKETFEYYIRQFKSFLNQIIIQVVLD